MNTDSENRPISSTEELYRRHYKVIAPLIMGLGVGDGQTTACVMAQAATIDALRKGLTLDKPTDEMECACPILRCMAIRLNDSNWWDSNEERTEALRPLIPLLLDSRVSGPTYFTRALRCADAAVRRLTPLRLEWIAKHRTGKVADELRAGAKELRDAAAIVDSASASAARTTCLRLRNTACCHADAAASAASAASAAYAAASAAYASASASAYSSAASYAYTDASYSADYASAYSSAASYAYSDCAAASSSDAASQRKVYRNQLLAVFMEIAAIND